MNEQDFKRAMGLAGIQASYSTRPDYWQGVQRGLRRAYHGERFGTAAEHDLWMTLADDADTSRRERGLGYRAGLAGDV